MRSTRHKDAHFYKTIGQEERYKVLAGYKVFNWSATEAFHPVDTINSRNNDGDLESLEKKGELTLEFEAAILEDGLLNFYYWPRFEDPEFPGKNSRVGTGFTLHGCLCYISRQR